MPAPSIKSVKSMFGKLKMKKGGQQRSPFFKKEEVSVPAPAPVLSGPSNRGIKTEDAKQEVTGTDIKKEEELKDKSQRDQKQAEDIVETVHGKGKETKPATKQLDKDFVNESFAAKKTEERISTKGEYSKIWASERSETLDEVHHSEYNRYTPNVISISESLRVAEQIVSGNINIEWVEKKFLSPVVRLYVYTMYIVRVIMIKEALRMNSTPVSTWLRKFLREYPPQSLPLTGFLKPQFNAIAAYAHPDEGRVSWTYPDIPENLWDMLCDNNNTSDGMRLTQPNPAILFDFMCQYLNLTPAQVNDAHHKDTIGNFIIYPLTGAQAADFTIGGKTVTVATHSRSDRLYLCNPVINEPFAESSSTLADRQPLWRTSKFRAYRSTTSNPTHGATLMDMLNLRDDMSWFTECVAMMRIFCSYFSDECTFGDLDFEGGPEVVIFSKTEFNKNQGTNNANVIDLKNQKLWYPQLYDNAYAEFYVYEKETSLACYLNAKHCLTNGLFKFKFRLDNANNNVTDINALANEATTAWTSINRRIPQATRPRSGPWFGNDRTGSTYHENDDATKPAITVATIHKRKTGYNVQVLSGREDLIRDGFYAY